MHKSAVTNSLFLNDESSLGELSKIAGALNLVRSQGALDDIAHQIIEIARRARLSRQPELCHRASRLLLSLPASPRLRAVGEYYNSFSQPFATLDIETLRNAIARTAKS